MKFHTLLITVFLASLIMSCKKQVIIDQTIKESDISTYQIKFSELKNNVRYLFENNEPESVSFDKTQRSFSTTEPLQLSIQKDSLKIRFYSPRPIKNLSIYGNTIGYQQKFLLAIIDSVPAFADLSIQLKDVDKERIYATENGKIVSIPGLQASDIKLTPVSKDPYFLTLQKIRIEWKCYFSPYSRSGNWSKQPISPPYMKEAVAIALNMTYILGSKDYRDSLLGPWQGLFYGNGGKKDTVDNQLLLANIERTRSIRFGLTNGGVGLGGEDGTYGLPQNQYLGHYIDAGNFHEVIIHEFGHVLGFDHNSGMTYGNWWGYGARMYARMSVSKELPVYSRQFLNTRANSLLKSSKLSQISKSSNFVSNSTESMEKFDIICHSNSY